MINLSKGKGRCGIDTSDGFWKKLARDSVDVFSKRFYLSYGLPLLRDALSLITERHDVPICLIFLKK
jgi:hypothetical protein